MSTEIQPTPETDAACWMQDWEGYRGEIVHSNFARKLERERDEAMREAIKVSLIRAYTAGYQHGHEATVEGGFIPVHYSDVTEFHAENIHQMLCDGSLPELQPFLKP